jgi:hypothetical protein
MAIWIGGTLMTGDRTSPTAGSPRARRGRWRRGLDQLALPWRPARRECRGHLSRPGVRASPVVGGGAGLRSQPLGDLEGDADFQAVAGKGEREQPLGALQAVQDGVAVGV